MIDEIEITKWPCIIISNWRVGSTGLLFRIADRYKNITKAYNEPLINSNRNFLDKNLNNFLYDVENNEKIMVKFHGWQLLTNPSGSYIKLLKMNPFIIRIKRRNIIDQITSYYIASKSKFIYEKRFNHDVKKIDINQYDVYKCVDRIVRSNIIVDALNVNYDVEFFYEDIMSLENTITNSARLFLPHNREEIKSEVEKIYYKYKNKKESKNLDWIPHNLNPYDNCIQQKIIEKYYKL